MKVWYKFLAEYLRIGLRSAFTANLKCDHVTATAVVFLFVKNIAVTWR